MPEIINWKLLSHPMNWVILFLMIFIVATALTFVLSYTSPKTTE